MIRKIRKINLVNKFYLSTKTTPKKDDKNLVFEWLKITKLDHIFSTLKKENFDSTQSFRLISNQNLIKMGVGASDREKLLTFLGKYSRDEVKFSKLKFSL